MLTPLARVDRCTGRNYGHLHDKQSNILRASSRFARIQRLHTSDGDKAQALAERALEHRLRAKSDKYSVATFRAQCFVHRIYNILTAGMVLFSAFVTGQIKVALSLRDPGTYKLSKDILYTYLVANCAYHKDHPQGPREKADDHRQRVSPIFFPTHRGETTTQQSRSDLYCQKVSKRRHTQS